MTGTALETAFSLLLLVSIIQGLRDVQVFHYKTMEVVVGQNTSLPCIIKDISNIHIVSTEWSKKGTKPSKLALYTPKLGSNLFSSNSTIKISNSDAGMLMGTYLELHNIDKRHAGTYICEFTIYPLGSHRRETELRIKDKIECDMNSTIEVSSGENVTIQCSVFTNVEYTWTKNETVVSGNHSLQLFSVTEANAGIYRLTVDTGNKRLHAEFIITVRTQTTSFETDVTTMSPDSSSSGATDAPVTSSSTEHAQSTVTALPVSYSQPHHSQNTSVSTTYQVQTTLSYNQSEFINTSITYNQSETTSTSTTFIYDTNTEYTSVINEIDSTVNDTEPPNASLSNSFKFTTLASTILLGNITKTPGATQTSSTVNTTDVTVQQDPANFDRRSHLLVALIIVGGVLLTFVALVLYRKIIIKKRLDLPPSFKPPPPPVKYTAVRNPMPPFPTARCNSVPAETAEICVNIAHTTQELSD